jgi:phytoene synthase
MTPEEYCRDKAARVGTRFYYSILFLPQWQRHAMTALHAFREEMITLVNDCREITVAEKKLDWWRKEIRSMFLGSPHHPVTRALSPSLTHCNLQEEYFHEIIDGMHMDLQYHRYPSFSELSLYCYRTSGVIGQISAEIFGYDNRRTLRATHDLWMALQLTSFLHNLHDDTERGHVYIPLDEMERHEVSSTDLTKDETTDRVKSLLTMQGHRATDLLHKGLEQLPAEDRYRHLGTVTMARLSLTLLNEIESDGYRILEHKVVLTPLRQLWIAWRTRVREHRQYQRFSVRKRPGKPQ